MAAQRSGMFLYHCLLRSPLCVNSANVLNFFDDAAASSSSSCCWRRRHVRHYCCSYIAVGSFFASYMLCVFILFLLSSQDLYLTAMPARNAIFLNNVSYAIDIFFQYGVE